MRVGEGVGGGYKILNTTFFTTAKHHTYLKRDAWRCRRESIAGHTRVITTLNGTVRDGDATWREAAERGATHARYVALRR